MSIPSLQPILRKSSPLGSIHRYALLQHLRHRRACRCCVGNLRYVLGTLSAVWLQNSDTTLTVSYDQGYDNAARPLTDVACSDGVNGVMWKYNWNVQGDIKNFPFIGGSAAIGGWNSPNCGTCWEASWGGKTIHVLAIDHAGSGLNIGLNAMQALTNGRAVELGRVEAQVTQVGLDKCGL